jgi:hypothetical protein
VRALRKALVARKQLGNPDKNTLSKGRIYGVLKEVVKAVLYLAFTEEKDVMSYNSWTFLRGAQKHDRAGFRAEAKVRKFLDVQTLMQRKQWLSDKNWILMNKKVKVYLNHVVTSPPKTRLAAFEFMDHLICLLLSGEVPCVRGQVM